MGLSEAPDSSVLRVQLPPTGPCMGIPAHSGLFIGYCSRGREYQDCPKSQISHKINKNKLTFLLWIPARGWSNSGDGGAVTSKRVQALLVPVQNPKEMSVAKGGKSRDPAPCSWVWP